MYNGIAADSSDGVLCVNAFFIAKILRIVRIVSNRHEGKAMRFAIFLTILAASHSAACGPAAGCREPDRPLAGSKLDKTLDELDRKINAVRTLQCDLAYRFSQPLFESCSVRKGVFFYDKTAPEPRLRVNFETLQQDDETPRPYREQFIFDGRHLVHVNYSIKQVKRYKRADPNETPNVSSLGAGGLGLLGLAGLDHLKRQFDITLAAGGADEPADRIRLALTPAGDSIYRDDFIRVEIEADRESGLPKKVTAISTREDIYEVSLLDPRINEKLDDDVFKLTVAEDFTIISEGEL